MIVGQIIALISLLPMVKLCSFEQFLILTHISLYTTHMLQEHYNIHYKWTK
jgi:hypothetical protein